MAIPSQAIDFGPRLYFFAPNVSKDPTTKFNLHLTVEPKQGTDRVAAVLPRDLQNAELRRATLTESAEHYLWVSLNPESAAKADSAQVQLYLADCVINNGSDQTMPDIFHPVSWSINDYKSFNKVTFKMNAVKELPPPGILIRRLPGNEEFWSYMEVISKYEGKKESLKKSVEDSIIRLNFYKENVRSGDLWEINKDRPLLKNTHLVPLSASKTPAKREGISFNNYDEVLTKLTSGTNMVSVYFKNGVNRIKIDGRTWTIGVAVNNVSDGLPADADFKGQVNFKNKDAPETVVIWLNATSNAALATSHEGRTQTPQFYYDKSITEDIRRKVTRNGIQLDAEVAKTIKEITHPITKNKEWLKFSKLKNNTQRRWVDLSEDQSSATVPECFGFYAEKNDKGINIGCINLSTVDISNIPEIKELTEWNYGDATSTIKKKLKAELVKSKFYVLLPDNPEDDQTSDESEYKQRIGFKSASDGADKIISWRVTADALSKATTRSPRVITLSKLMALAVQTKKIGDFTFEISPLEALQSKNQVTLKLMSTDLAFGDDNDIVPHKAGKESTLTLISSQQQTKRYIKPSAEGKSGVMILVDNYQPWSVGVPGASSLQGSIWDSIDKVLSGMGQVVDTVVVGMVNQNYEVLDGTADARQRQIALFKLRRLVFNEFDLQPNGTDASKLAQLVHPDPEKRHDNAANNTLTTLLPEASEWKVCFVTPTLIKQAVEDVAALKQLGVNVSFVQISQTAQDGVNPTDLSTFSNLLIEKIKDALK